MHLPVTQRAPPAPPSHAPTGPSPPLIQLRDREFVPPPTQSSYEASIGGFAFVFLVIMLPSFFMFLCGFPNLLSYPCD